MPNLKKCEQYMEQETTAAASVGEILLLHKGEKQKLVHFQNKVSKDRDHKKQVQGRIYKHMTHKWHRRQRLLHTMGNTIAP